GNGSPAAMPGLRERPWPRYRRDGVRARGIAAMAAPTSRYTVADPQGRHLARPPAPSPCPPRTCPANLTVHSAPNERLADVCPDLWLPGLRHHHGVPRPVHEPHRPG